MRWRRIVFWVTFSTLAVVVLALSWLWTADLGVFKPQLERFVTEQTGRGFSIDGEFHVDLAGKTTIIAEDVRFANAEWSETADMVTIGRAEVRIDLWSLISGPVLVELIDVDDTSILLLNPGDNAPNWKLPVAAGPGGDPDDEPGIGVLFAQIDVDRLQVRLESVERDRPLHLVIERFDQQHRDDNYLDLEIRGSLDGRRVDIDGEFGTWDALLAGSDFDIDLDAVLDTFTLSARGRIDDIADLQRPALEFTASGPDVDDLTRLLGLGEEGEGDINLSGSLKPVADGPLTLNFKGNIGLTEIDAHGELADLQSYENLRLRAVASGPDLGRILRLAGIHQVRQAPFMLDIDAEMTGERLEVREATLVFADARLEGTAELPRFPSVDDATISLQIEGPRMEQFRYITGLPGAATGPFSLGLTVDVREDGVEVLQLDVETSLGEIHGNGTVGDPSTFIGSRFDVTVRTNSLAMLGAAYGVDDLPNKPAELAGAAQYTAEGIRTDGPLSVVIDGNAATVSGLIALREDLRGTDVVVASDGDDLAQLVGMFADPAGVPTLPYDVGGKLRIAADGFRWSDIRGSLGSASISASGLLVPAAGLAGSRFDLRASGPAFEELLAALGDVSVEAGPFELSTSAAFRADGVRFEGVSLTRPAASLQLDLDLGLPVSRRWMDFDLVAGGKDVRALLRNIEGLEARAQPFSITAKGRLRGLHWDFDTVDGTVGAAGFQARGDLALEDSKSRTDFTLNVSVPNLADIGSVDGRRFNPQALALNAHAVGSNGQLAVDGLNLRIGQSDVTGSITYRAGAVPEVGVNVHSDRLVILPLLEETEEIDPEPEFDDGRLIPDIAVPFDAMKRMNATVIANVAELQRKNLFLKDIEVRAHLRGGALDVPTVRFKARSGEMLAKGSLAPGDGQGEATILAIARDFAPGLFDANVDLAMTSDLDVDLRSTGTDLRALAGNANGVIYIDTRGGRLKLGDVITAIYGNMLEEMLNTINPARKKNPYTDFECLIVPLTVTDGMVTGAPDIFASTAKIRAVTQGSVNLKTEEIRIGVRTTPRQVVSISAAELFNPYLQVVGTLAAPRLAVDEAGVLITGGAAVATGGLSLLARGLWDRLSKSGDACKQVSKEALKALEGRVPVMQIPDSERPE